MKLFSLIFTLIITCSSVFATTVTIPNSFSSGTATNAAQMNANFSAVKAAVDDNDSRITTLQSSNNAAASQFMGFSSATPQGSSGLVTMSNACHNSFSGSHMCSTLEFAGAKMNSPSNLSGNAWIRPSVGEIHSSASNNAYMDLADGVVYAENQGSCMGWAATTFSSITLLGRVVTAEGKRDLASCVNLNKVACCK